MFVKLVFISFLAYNHTISIEKVKEIYQDFDQSAIRLLELADPDGFRVWKLMDMESLPRWSTNRTVLIGDASHPVLPHSFSGASMAIEDAVALALVLPAGVTGGHDDAATTKTTDPIRERLQLFEAIRKPRVAHVRDMGRQIGAGRQDAPDRG